MKTRLFKCFLLSSFLIISVNITKAASLTITSAGLNNTAVNGITSGSLNYQQTGIVLYGFSLTSTFGTTTVTKLIFTSSQGTITNYFGAATFKLYSSGTNNYTTGSPSAVPGATYAVSGNTVTVTLSQAISATNYYFLAADYSVNGNTPVGSTTQIYFNLTTITSNAAMTNNSAGNGVNFTLAPPVVTITDDNSTSTNGITASNIGLGQSGIVMFGFTIKVSTAASTLKGFTLTASQTVTNYFGSSTFKLYRAGSSNYLTGPNTQITSAVFSVSGTTITVTGLSDYYNADASTATTTSMTYFVVADYNTAGSVSATEKFTCNANGNGTSYTAGITSTATVTAGGTISGNTFNMQAPTVTFSGNNTAANGITPNPIAYGQTGIVLYGFQLTDSNSPTTVTQVYLSSPGGEPIQQFFSNFKVVSCPTSIYSAASATPVTATLTQSGSAFYLNSMSESLAINQTKYYFVLGDWTSTQGNVLPYTEYLNYTSLTSSVTNSIITTSGTTTGQNFPLASPTVTIVNYTTGMYTGTIFSAGNTYNMLGFSLSYNAPTNMHQLKIDISYLAPTTYSFTDYVTQGGSVQLIDAATGLSPTYVSSINVNSNNILINFTSAPISTTLNLYLKITFANTTTWNTHQPGPFMMCINAASNPSTNFCMNNSGCSVVDNYINSTTGSACSQTFYPQTVLDWVGTTLSNGDDWNVATNWSPNKVPGAYDIAREGVNNGFNKLPVIYTTQSGSTTINVGSIIFGSTTSGSFNTLGVTVNSGYTLNVSGDITMQSDAQSWRNYPVNLAGAGTIQAANLNILTSNTAATHAISAVVNSSVNSLVLSGNIKLTSDYTAAYSMAYNSTFKLTGGTTSVTGILQSTTTAGSLCTFAIIPAASATATLQLNNAAALSGLSTTANTNTLSFNNTGSRVEYSGAAQTIYTDAPITGLTTATGPIYYGLKITGTGTKTPNGGSLQIYGDFGNNRGTALDLSSTPVLFEGTTQNLKDGSSNNTLFSTVTFSGAGTKTISSGSFAVASTGTLTMSGTNTATVLDTGTGLLTLNSDANSSATVAKINGPSIKGNVYVQRYISGGASTYRGYRLLSSPVNVSSSTTGTGNIDFSYLNNGTGTGAILTAGPGGPANGFSVINGNPLLYLYDETRTTNNSSFYSGKNVGIAAIAGASGSPTYTVSILSPTGAVTPGVTVPVGNSFLLYYVGSASSTDITSVLRPIPDAATTTALGYLNQGNVPVTFWNTNSTSIPYDNNGGYLPGLNQVGNPYASTISLDQLYADNPAISPLFWELNVPGGTYISYNASSGATSNSRASKYIVSGQGFVMQAKATGQTITFKEDQKVAYPSGFTTSSTPGSLLLSLPSTPSSTTDVKAFSGIQPQTTSPSPSGLHLQITKDSVTNTQTGIYFSSDWSDTYNTAEDAIDLDGTTPKVYLSSYSSDGKRLGINELGNYIKGKRIKLYTNATATGTYTLSLADITNIDTGAFNVFLVDNKMKDSLDMVRYNSYAFNVTTTDTTTYGANRFVLAIERRPLPQYLLVSFTGQKASKGIQLYWQSQNAGDYTGFILQKLDANNNYNSLYSTQSTNTPLYAYLDQHPANGNNTYRLQQTDAYGDITYSAPVTIFYNSTLQPGSLTIYPNPAKTTININLYSSAATTPNYIENIYDTSGNLIEHKSVNSNSWAQDISSYKLGVYFVEVKTNDGNFIGKCKFVKVN